MISLTHRLLLAGSVVLTSFFGITGFTLEQAFRESAEAAVRERLQAHAVGLIAASEQQPGNTLTMPANLPEARYITPASGLYARVMRRDGKEMWRSPSLRELGTFPMAALEPGASRFQQGMSGGVELFIFSIAVAGNSNERTAKGYTFAVAEDTAAFNLHVSDFSQRLWGALAAVAILLLAVQGTILRWSLAPVRQAAAGLDAIKRGERQRLEGRYPPELRGLTDNLNALLASQREHLERYRDTLGNIAHSLKTPLAVLRGAVDTHAPDELTAVAREQVDRMNQIVEYQLQRAATSGRMPLVAPISMARAAQKIRDSLAKVYAGKEVDCRLDVPTDAHFHGDEGDLLELLGNLMDNAYKWCGRNVRVSAVTLIEPRLGLRIEIEDDGPGIEPGMAQTVLQRGVRADSETPGHGIGLAIMQDIVRVYEGTFTIERSALGGAKVSVFLPQG